MMIEIKALVCNGSYAEARKMKLLNSLCSWLPKG